MEDISGHTCGTEISKRNWKTQPGVLQQQDKGATLGKGSKTKET